MLTIQPPPPQPASFHGSYLMVQILQARRGLVGPLGASFSAPLLFLPILLPLILTFLFIPLQHPRFFSVTSDSLSLPPCFLLAVPFPLCEPHRPTTGILPPEACTVFPVHWPPPSDFFSPNSSSIIYLVSNHQPPSHFSTKRSTFETFPGLHPSGTSVSKSLLFLKRRLLLMKFDHCCSCRLPPLKSFIANSPFRQRVTKGQRPPVTFQLSGIHI